MSSQLNFSKIIFRCVVETDRVPQAMNVKTLLLLYNKIDKKEKHKKISKEQLANGAGWTNAQSELYFQHQNQANCKIQDIKRTINIMDNVTCPTQRWLLCTIFMLMLFCHLPNLIGEIPLAMQTS